MNRLAVFIFLFGIISCSPKGYWQEQDRYRAKNPNYKLAAEEFVTSSLVDTNFLYQGIDSMIIEGNKSLKTIIGFNSDGTAFLNSYSSDDKVFMNSKYSNIDSAQQLGYYRVNGAEIKFERLVPYDFGQYVIWEGEITGDTIVFKYKNFPSKVRKYKFVKSNFPK